MPSFGIVALFNRLIVAVLAALAAVGIDSVPPLERADDRMDRL